jgi:uroporphyrin-3 C-methyltransferase
MSDNTNDERPPDEATVAELAADNEPVEPAAITSVPRSKSGAVVAWLALIAAAAALAAFGYLYFAEWRSDERPNPNDERIAALATTLQDTRQAVEALDAAIDELAGEAAGRDRQFEAIEDRFAERLRRLDSLPDRIGSLESSLASLRGISSGLRDSWLLAEAEYYMQIANAQLQLNNNPKLALLALQLADEKVVQLANPALTDIRRALADELRALNSIDTPDIEGIALTLSSLAAVVDSLPLDEKIAAPDAENAAVDAELSGMQRVLASLRKTVSGVVSVRRSDEAVRPLIAPEAQYFLRANLALQLQAARIALLRGQQTLYDQSLDDAASWLNRYYDTNSTPVRSALQTVSEARQNVMPVSLPDISGSLRLLREYRVLSATDRQAPADKEPASEDEASR